MLTLGSRWEEKNIWVFVDVVLAWNLTTKPKQRVSQKGMWIHDDQKMAKMALLSADYNDNVTMIMAGVLWGTVLEVSSIYSLLNRLITEVIKLMNFIFSLIIPIISISLAAPSLDLYTCCLSFGTLSSPTIGVWGVLLSSLLLHVPFAHS